MKDLFFIVGVMLGVAMIVLSCILVGEKVSHRDTVDKRDSETKCFEQTLSQECWGIK